ncbi:hypothetical protein CYMTET_19413 [Cymbomonas tetramitiformis]|uniref:Cytochrome b5 heme-binding domain-containing protein n=1 Tax=Cymbomonas tetramitiformis TaxID=36881 RepID=A0AAE0G7F7_9CHLO|nr:hypothetical protein CYMTET_19413 [Cymbomonas tetramitiformis]|eukprot:gene4698-5752_t
MREISQDELAANCGTRFASDERPSSEKLWVAIDGYVYDLTKFEKLHPGGKAVLRMVGGQECTKEFYALHNKSVLEKYHKRLCVGKLKDSEQNLTNFETSSAMSKEEEQESLASKVPFAEIPLLRPNWVRQPWWTDSHRDFLFDLRKKLSGIQEECEQIEKQGKYVPDELQEVLGKEWNLLSCLNGTSVMPIAQKLGLVLPGGLQPKEFDLFHEYIAHAEFGRRIPVGTRNGLAGGMAISLPAIAHFAGNMPEALREQIVADVLSGKKKSCLAVSEPQAGSDVANIITMAVKSKCGKYYIVNGIKKWITGGMNADYFVTAVRTGPVGSGMKGISLLLVDKSFGGVTLKHIKTSDAMAAATAWVYYDDVHVPVEYLMGQENKGFRCIVANFNHERWLICAGVVGSLRTILEDCFLWATQREVFGKALIQQPVIRQKLARMIGGLESLEAYMDSITYQMAHMDSFTQMIELGGPTAILKFQVTRVMTMISDEAVQIFGGRALTASGLGKNIEQMQRTFKFASILGGSEEIMADLGVRQAMAMFPQHARL